MDLIDETLDVFLLRTLMDDHFDSMKPIEPQC